MLYSKSHVQVIFKITRDGESGSYKHVFAIGDASLEGGLDGAEGNGTLAGGQKGSATWLMIPLSEAAPGIDDAQYFVSLYFNGQEKGTLGCAKCSHHIWCLASCSLILCLLSP